MMKVRELIALLQTFDPELPVTGYNGQEETDFVSEAGVRLKEATKHDNLYLGFAPTRLYVGPYVDIMGF